MIASITADEITEFRTAVAGVEIDWVRTDEGHGPATMTSCGDDRLALSNGGLDFSALLHAEIPTDRLVLQLVTCAPEGMTWCGNEADDYDLRVFSPGSYVFGTVPAGSRAITVVADLEGLTTAADQLGAGALHLPADAAPLPRSEALNALVGRFQTIARQPELLETPGASMRVLEQTALALTGEPPRARRPSGRGFDSRSIVADCIEYVEATGRNQPSIGELCRVAHASESRLRHAFVDLFDVAPVQYFQLRTLSLLRSRLLVADPSAATVTDIATSLGLTQFGRVAGRYRAVFGETPRTTLRQQMRFAS